LSIDPSIRSTFAWRRASFWHSALSGSSYQQLFAAPRCSVAARRAIIACTWRSEIMMFGAAALEVATGRITAGACYERHRHQEFLAFLKQVAKAHPRVPLHVVCDNYSSHKTDHRQRGRVPRRHRAGGAAMTVTSAPPRPSGKPERADFLPALRAECVKFRTVRGWLIGLVLAALLCATFTFLVANGNNSNFTPSVPTGPGGEAVADTYYILDQPLTGDGTVTTRITSLTGLISTAPSNEAASEANPGNPTSGIANTRARLADWAKAGILLTPSTAQGSAYAAVMATGSHGDHFQDDYTHDAAGMPGTVTAAAPRWLRLTRSGETVTGYD